MSIRMAGLVTYHDIDIGRYLLPASGNAINFSLAAHLTINTDISCDPLHGKGPRIKTSDHVVHSIFQRLNLSLCMYFNSLRHVTARDGLRHIRYASHLAREVA